MCDLFYVFSVCLIMHTQIYESGLSYCKALYFILVLLRGKGNSFNIAHFSYFFFLLHLICGNSLCVLTLNGYTLLPEFSRIASEELSIVLLMKFILEFVTLISTLNWNYERNLFENLRFVSSMHNLIPDT